MTEPPPCLLRRRWLVQSLVAIAATPVLSAIGCRRAGHGEAVSTPSRKTRPPSYNPPAFEPQPTNAIIASLIDGRPARSAAEAAQYTSLQGILEFIPYASPVRAIHRVADPLIAGARRVVVFQEIGARGGSSEWERAEQPTDADSRASRARQLRESADEFVRPTTLVLYEDADGIGFVTDLPRPLTAAEVVDHSGVFLSGSVTAVHWEFEPSAGQTPAPGRAAQFDRALEAFRQLVASVGRTELLHGGESSDGCDAHLVSVYEQGAPPRTVAGVNVQTSQTMATRAQAAYEVHRLIDQGVRRQQDAR
jgi:hypothetical protein